MKTTALATALGLAALSMPKDFAVGVCLQPPTSPAEPNVQPRIAQEVLKVRSILSYADVQAQSSATQALTIELPRIGPFTPTQVTNARIERAILNGPLDNFLLALRSQPLGEGLSFFEINYDQRPAEAVAGLLARLIPQLNSEEYPSLTLKHPADNSRVEWRRYTTELGCLLEMLYPLGKTYDDSIRMPRSWAEQYEELARELDLFTRDSLPYANERKLRESVRVCSDVLGPADTFKLLFSDRDLVREALCDAKCDIAGDIKTLETWGKSPRTPPDTATAWAALSQRGRKETIAVLLSFGRSLPTEGPTYHNHPYLLEQLSFYRSCASDIACLRELRETLRPPEHSAPEQILPWAAQCNAVIENLIRGPR